VNDLFIEIYLDEDVSVLVAELLRARGFTAVTTQQAGNLGASDRAQIDYATYHQLTLLTHNRSDFELLGQEYFSSGAQHSGVIIAVRRRPMNLVKRLLRVIDSVARDEMRNQIIYV
jgi:predicted nuclease of predicted toxin-antitoxin system